MISKLTRREVLKLGGTTAGAVVGGSMLGTDAQQKQDEESNNATANTKTDGVGPTLDLGGSWATAPQPPLQYTHNLSTEGFDNQTIRSILHTSVGGDHVRVRLTNEYGTDPVTFDHVTIGVRSETSETTAAVRDTPVDVTFSSSTSITLPSGARVYSDPVPLTVAPIQELVVSLYAPAKTGPATWHGTAKHRTYTACDDHAGDSSGKAFSHVANSWFFLDGVDVRNPDTKGTVVALGDSITDGTGSSLGTYHTWPGFLARRITDQSSVTKGVLNAGIGGNRVLHDSACCGENAIARLNQDVFGQTGVTDVILLEGINDIGFSQLMTKATAPHSDITAEHLINGYQQIIARVHAKGLWIHGGTLTPYKGSLYWTPKGEQTRQTVNHWIRTSGEFDSVVDFDQTIQNPERPLYILDKYDSGDNLHPSDAGYRQMAAIIDLAQLKHT